MKRIIFAAALACIGTMALANDDCRPASLRSEAMEAPIGIDVTRPRLSWKMEDSRRGAAQTAYRVQMATSREALQEDKADVWDSGRKEGSSSVEIAYGGPDLKPLTTYYWRVKLWDKDGKETEYSEPTIIETGFLGKDGWKAKWIAAPYKEDKPDNLLEQAEWIWLNDVPNAAKKAPKGNVFFTGEMEVPADARVESAQLSVLADNEAIVYINGQRAAHIFGFKGAPADEVTKFIKPGKNVVQVNARNESEGPAGLALALGINLVGGKQIVATTDKSWKTSGESGADWPEGGSGTAKWEEASVLGEVGMQPWKKPAVSSKGGPASLHRKEFKAGDEVESARLYITALGSYRAEINGQRVGNDILTPDWTDYRHRLTYQTYDVKDLVEGGSDNALGVVLGDGWYATALGWGLQRWCFGESPTRFMAELHLKYADGKQDVIATDGTWKYSQAPILRSELYAGETYDARLEQDGWSKAGFDDKEWQAVLLPETDTSKVAISGQSSPPIRAVKEISPIEITEPVNGAYVVDMGQNMVGWARLTVKGNAGDKVRMRFAEILNPDGTVYTTNLRRAEATDTYTLKGGPEETFEPHFTYHGFRYIEVTGFPGKLHPENITGVVFHTDAPFVGSFEASDPMVTQIVTNTMWGLRGNLHSVPTDCPQRDERLGWTGDAQAIWKTACYNLDMQSFTEKWSRDLIDAQGEKGDYPNVAPRVISTEPGAPAWGDAGVIVPFDGWEFYANRKNIADMWDSMEGWMKYILEENQNFIWEKRRGNDYGDWVPANSETDKTLIATAYWAGNARHMSIMAEELGKPEKKKEYDELYSNIRKAFQEKFIKPDGKIANGSQTCYILALENGLVQPDMVEKAVKHLVDDIASRGNHLSTGFLGSTYLMPVLTENGHNDVAVTLLLNKTFPSWGYMIEKGATTIWERWNSDTGDPAMNSFNHYTYGAVTDWLYGYFCGIRPARPGFEEVLIEPHPDKRVQWARATYNSSLGEIVSEWQFVEDDLELKITLPANAKGVISLPASDAAKVTESGKSLKDAGLEVVSTENGRVNIKAVAGAYEFAVKK